MATRLYSRNTTTNTAGFPAGDLSTAMTDSGGGSFGSVDCKTTKGTLQASSSLNTTGLAAAQNLYFGRLVSDQVGVSAIDANTWTIALAGLESNTNANLFWKVSIQVVTSAFAVRGFVYDSNTPLSTELDLTETGRVFTIAGSAVAGVLSTDRLAFEMWVGGTPSMAVVYTTTNYIAGTTDPTNGVAVASAATYFETPQDLFPVAAADPPVSRNRITSGLVMRGRR